jgi:hypothetical protein
MRPINICSLVVDVMMTVAETNAQRDCVNTVILRPYLAETMEPMATPMAKPMNTRPWEDQQCT